ncbi:hypothetical protein HY972_00430 [Candidatus Kaiserbacteria bacterium]|nr:hypothetical protein [Candidatus Kaiserbacteria bacterium]
MSKFEGKPKEVRRAILADDRGALSAMGKKGAEQANINRVFRKAAKERVVKELIREQAPIYSVGPGGDVLPPDQKVLEALSEEE